MSEPHAAPGAAGESYYGRPIVKAQVWTPIIPAYFWIGGTMAACSVQGAIARARGNDALADVMLHASFAGSIASPVLLILDLGVPSRFLHMLRVFKLTSPMSVGTYILIAWSSAIGGALGARLLGWTALSRALEIAATPVAAALATYTAVLVADTATPVWHEARETLPFVFAASGVAGAGAIGAAFVAPEHARSARRMLVGGALLLVTATTVMERRLGAFLAEPLTSGLGGALARASTACALAGACVSLAVGSRGRGPRALASALVCAAGILERYAIVEAGTASANDPKYTVVPQRARLDAREAAAAARQAEVGAVR